MFDQIFEPAGCSPAVKAKAKANTKRPATKRAAMALDAITQLSDDDDAGPQKPVPKATPTPKPKGQPKNKASAKPKASLKRPAASPKRPESAEQSAGEQTPSTEQPQSAAEPPVKVQKKPASKDIKAYKYMYHTKKMWGIKVNGVEFATVGACSVHKFHGLSACSVRFTLKCLQRSA